MEEGGKELIDIDENGDYKKEENDKQKSKFNLKKILLILALVLIFIILICFVITKFFKNNKSKNIELIIADNYDEMSKKAAEIISDLIKANPKANLGLATGSTPIGLYNELIKKNKNKEITFKDIKSYNLDEYVGISQNHSQSYYYFMKNTLFNYIDININNTHIPKGEGDIQTNIENYENELSKNKINMQLLGVGRNGHIGFNEPGTDFNLGVHDVLLDEKTIHDNARFFDNDINKVPKKAITMGIKNILDADNIILMANGTKKADAIKYVMSGVVDEQIPVSALNIHKGKVYIIVDKDAASKL